MMAWEVVEIAARNVLGECTRERELQLKRTRSNPVKKIAVI
jgi:hypothetical protein